MRKALTFLLLLGLVFAVWMGARYFVHRGEVRATIVFKDASALHPGDPVVENGTVCGKVTSFAHLDGQDAVVIRLGRDHRRAIVTDSLFSIEHGQLVVTNTVAVGRPIDDNVVLYAREDRLSRWLAKHGGFIDRLRQKTDAAFDDQFAQWSADVPKWKSEGSASFDKHLAEAKARVAKIEDDLRKSKRVDEANAVKEKFEHWLEEVKR